MTDYTTRDETLGRAWVEFCTEYEWNDLPQTIKDSIMTAAHDFAEWADADQGIVQGEVIQCEVES